MGKGQEKTGWAKEKKNINHIIWNNTKNARRDEDENEYTFSLPLCGNRIKFLSLFNEWIQTHFHVGEFTFSVSCKESWNRLVLNLRLAPQSALNYSTTDGCYLQQAVNFPSLISIISSVRLSIFYPFAVSQHISDERKCFKQISAVNIMISAVCL